MITFENLETPEDYPLMPKVMEGPELIITLSGKAIDKVDNIEIYFKREDKNEV